MDSKPVEPNNGVGQEDKIDNNNATRTSRYDQDLKERARTYGINPDNFDSEDKLVEVVLKAEEGKK